MAQNPESIKKIDFNNIKKKILINHSKDNWLSIKIICNFITDTAKYFEYQRASSIDKDKNQ